MRTALHTEAPIHVAEEHGAWLAALRCMQTNHAGPTWLVTLILVLVGTTNTVRAQEVPTPRDDDPQTGEAAGHARMSPGRQVSTAHPRLALNEGLRHPQRAQRLVRTGGALLGLGVFGFIVGAAVSAAAYEPCADDEFCFDLGPEVGVLASAVFVAPLLVVGAITTGRGVRRRAREQRLSAGIRVAGGRYGFVLVGRF